MKIRRNIYEFFQTINENFSPSKASMVLEAEEFERLQM